MYKKEERIGVLKVTPKIQKLRIIDADSWKHLTSRPIRGAENCPLNPASKALCGMFQHLLKDLKSRYKLLTDSSRNFSCLKGCGEYSSQ